MTVCLSDRLRLKLKHYSLCVFCSYNVIHQGNQFKCGICFYEDPHSIHE